MTGRRFAGRLATVGVALSFLLILPACRGDLFPRRGGGREVLRPSAPVVVPHSAYRPAFSPGPPRKTLFLGGYAGYVYGPSRPLGYVPTSRGVQVWEEPIGHHAPSGPHRR